MFYSLKRPQREDQNANVSLALLNVGCLVEIIADY